MVRASCTLKDLAGGDGLVSRTRHRARRLPASATGTSTRAEAAAPWFARAEAAGWKAVIEFAPEARKRTLELWPSPGGDFEIMKRIKAALRSVATY